MKRIELLEQVGKNIKIIFKDGKVRTGVLEYVDEFSMKYDFCPIGYFRIGHLCFKVSHVKKCEV